MASVLVVIAIGSILVLMSVCECVIPEHLVTDLPGQPAVKFRQYAGYIDVGNKHLFYWFVEADHPRASSLPITFWFNGGQFVFTHFD